MSNSGQNIKWRSAKGGKDWPIMGWCYLVKLRGVIQHETFEFDQADDGVSGGDYFWSRDDIDECPLFDSERDEWVRVDDLAALPADGAEAAAVVDFVNMMIGSYESGFVDTCTLDLATLHRVMENHCKDSYGVDVPGLSETWGEETAMACRALNTKGEQRSPRQSYTSVPEVVTLRNAADGERIPPRGVEAECYECGRLKTRLIWESRCVACTVQKLELNMEENESLRSQLEEAHAALDRVRRTSKPDLQRALDYIRSDTGGEDGQ